MSDIIRMARAIYPNFDAMNQEAGQIKAEYVQQGGDPLEVFSPERVQALQEGGPAALEADQARQREDGSIAAPYVPTELALATNMIEPGAVPAVLEGLLSGVNTVSSGVDSTGRGYAIGRSPDGTVVRITK